MKLLSFGFEKINNNTILIIFFIMIISQFFQDFGVAKKKRQAMSYMPEERVIEVDFSATLQYTRGSIIISGNGGTVHVETIPHIEFLYLYNDQGTFVQSFRRESDMLMQGYGNRRRQYVIIITTVIL